MAKRKKLSAALISLPIALFTLVFVISPFIFLIITSFSAKDGSFGTISNYTKILEPVYRKIFLSSITMGLATSLLVVLFGYPFGYFMAKLSEGWKRNINYLLLIPFCVSSVLRLYGWDIMFRNNGPINKLLLFLNIIEKPLKLKYTFGATLVIMVYALLPFMILAVYSSAEKLDWSLMEASRDLGASSFQSFLTVGLPLTLPGLLSGVILTFIPSMGLMFISELFGGNKIQLVGNVILQEAILAKNRPFAAALAMVLMVLTSLFIFLYRKLFNTSELEGLV